MITKEKKLKKTVDVANRAVTFAPVGHEPMTVVLSNFNDAIVTRLALHGLSQKLGDCFAKDTITEGMAAFLAVRAAMENGDWTVGGRAESGPADLITAIANLTGKTYAETEKAIMARDEAGRKKIAADPAVKAEIGRIRQARLDAAAASGTSIVDDLFG